MSYCPMTPVEAHGVDAVQLSHAAGQIRLLGLNDEVVVVGHEAVAMAEPVGVLSNRLQEIEKSLSVEVISENGMTGIAAGGDVVKGTRVLNSQGSSHATT